MDALHRSFTLSKQIASVAVIVDAKDEQAMKEGFSPCGAFLALSG
jgi:hypothetical protein